MFRDVVKVLFVVMIVYSGIEAKTYSLISPDLLNLKLYDGVDLMKEEEKREFLYGFKTIFAPEYSFYNSTYWPVNRKKRNTNLSNRTETIEEILNDLSETLQDLLVDRLEPNKNYILENNSIRNKRNSSLVNFPSRLRNETQKLIPEVVLHHLKTFMSQKLNAQTTSSKPSLRPFFSKQARSEQEIRMLQSNLMKKYMNNKTDPCDDFYDYACGNWKKYFIIPPDRTTYDTFEMVRENLDNVIRDILDDIEVPPVSEELDQSFRSDQFARSLFQPSNQLNPTSALVKVKHFYMSCMNQDVINGRGDEPLMRIINQLGGWPILNKNWNLKNFDTIWVLAQLRLLNNDVLISEWVGPDMKNSNEYIIHIDQTSLGLPSREYYVDPANIKYLNAYKAFITEIVHILGGRNVQKDVNEIVDFEINLAVIMSSSEDKRNVSDVYLRTDLETLPLYFPQFDWHKYFSIILGRTVNPQYPVACYCSEYLQKLTYRLSVTPERVIQNYILWRFIRHRTSNLGHKFTDAKQRFYNVLFGREEEPPRWTFCVSQANANMGMAVGALFVKKYFDKGSRNDTIHMTEQLEAAFRDTLLENLWLDNHTKEYARMKINQMDLKIGFPDFILNEKQLAERYDDIQIHPEYFFENILLILRHLTRSEQTRIGNKVNRSLWSTSPAVVNAYYSRNKNQILFPAGILQPPFYHKFFPKALNFGGIGVVIGHEITHGFDDKGRLFDHEGNLHLWWREASIQKFYAKATCLINQYSRFVLPEINSTLDGFLTQGENIADNGGLKQAFRAYSTWLKSNNYENEKLPGMDLNGKQLFFLNFAQVWCGQQRLEAAKSRMKTSVHAPGIFRVIGALSNSEDFARAYNCPKGSPMNPVTKCTIW